MRHIASGAFLELFARNDKGKHISLHEVCPDLYSLSIARAIIYSGHVSQRCTRSATVASLTDRGRSLELKSNKPVPTSLAED
jgi:hypothetical protein